MGPNDAGIMDYTQAAATNLLQQYLMGRQGRHGKAGRQS